MNFHPKLAALISVPLGVTVSFTLSFFGASYVVSSSDGEMQDVLFGPAATLSIIESYGLWSWFLGLLPQAAVLSGTTYVGCLLFSYVLSRRS